MRHLALVALTLAAGCQTGIYFDDDEAGPFAAGSPFTRHADDLSLPYALGTSVGLAVHQTPRDLAGWTLSSDAPAIFAVDQQMVDSDGNLTATGHALAEGSAHLRLLDAGGSERHTAAVEVRAADSARFYAHGELRVLGDNAARDYAQAEITEARVLVGGQAVVAVAYFRGPQRVYGRKLATLPLSVQLAVEDHTSGGSPVTDWLFMEATQPGDYTLPLVQNGVTLGTLPVTAVADSDVTSLTLAGEPTAAKNDGDKSWILARAAGSDGREILGVYCDWTLDGVAQQNDQAVAARGDLYRYRFAGGPATRALVATHGSLSATVAVAAHDGYVSDTTYLGCAAAPGAPSPSPRAIVALALLAALFGARLLRRAAAAR